MTEEYTLKETVFRSFLKKSELSPTKMATYLKANYNSVKAAFAKLADEGLLDREGRGNYSPNYSNILLHLLDRIEELEKIIPKR
jgi:Mn-dependent DtxR family transcriptional regulator